MIGLPNVLNGMPPPGPTGLTDSARGMPPPPPAAYTRVTVEIRYLSYWRLLLRRSAAR